MDLRPDSLWWTPNSPPSLKLLISPGLCLQLKNETRWTMYLSYGPLNPKRRICGPIGGTCGILSTMGLLFHFLDFGRWNKRKKASDDDPDFIWTTVKTRWILRSSDPDLTWKHSSSTEGKSRSSGSESITETCNSFIAYTSKWKRESKRET